MMAIREKASCGEHDKHRRTCGKCAEAELEHVFPELDDWQREVAATAGLKKWRAGMVPVLSGDDPVEFTLESPYVATGDALPGLQERLALKGPNRRHILIAALLYAREQG
jgi:hypothetical protein